MSTSVFDTAPGFDQPIAVLKHCHDRIRRNLATLGLLPAHLAAHGADDEARRAADGILRYFTQAAPLHHADEEDNLLPMLQDVATGADALALQEILPQIMAEHVRMEAAWSALEPGLRAVSSGEAASLTGDAGAFAALYAAHMELEESVVAPMAKRLFDGEAMARLGAAMRARRGIAPQE